MNSSVAIVGAGVSGLSCGVVLQQQGITTQIIAKEVSPDTTSDISAALWYPYKAEPVDKVLKWGKASMQAFQKLTDNKQSGVSMIPVIELLETYDPDPWWKEIVLNFRMADPHEIPADYEAGYHFEAPLIEMPVYMNYLRKEYLQLGGSIEQLEHPLQSFEPILHDYPITINCTGLGSKELLGDDHLYPIRGQVVVVNKIDLDHCLIDLEGKRALSYIIPRQNDCVLGGTSEANRWEEDIDPAVTKDILDKCRELVPELKDADIHSEKVGLRPARTGGIRLEAEQVQDKQFLIHNYGHGGAGITLSWGCAREVYQLLKQTLDK